VIRSQERIVATASVKQWRPLEDNTADHAFKRDRPDDCHLLDAGRTYEVGAVAILPESAFQRKGLATRCMAVLQEALLTKHQGGDILL
jgi:hypothetical protein